LTGLGHTAAVHKIIWLCQHELPPCNAVPGAW